jgi:hypothetical protein
MAPPAEKLLKRISELIARRNNVDFDEIEWVLNQLGINGRKAKHGIMYKMSGCKGPLMLNKHNNGKSHLPPYCVDQFRKRMVELGLYAQDESNDNEDD